MSTQSVSAPSAEEFAATVLDVATGYRECATEFDAVAKPERAEIDRLVREMEALYPELRDTRRGPNHPWSQLFDAITRAWIVAHNAGIREGAAAENLRREMIAVRVNADDIEFADRILETASRYLDKEGGFRDYCPREYAASEAAREKLEEALPELKDTPAGHPYQVFLEATMSLYMDAHSAGVRDGIAAEQFRQSSLATRAAHAAPPAAPTLPKSASEPVLPYIANSQAILNDPFRFAREMAEPIFYSDLAAALGTTRDDLGANWTRATNLLIRAVRSGDSASVTEATHIIANLGTDTMNDAIDSIGIPFGVALERIRLTLLDTLAETEVNKANRADRYQRDTDRIAAAESALDRAA